MRHESKFAAWIRSGGNSVFVLPLGPTVRAPEGKFSVVPNRLLDSIIDDALVAGVARLPFGMADSLTAFVGSPLLAQGCGCSGSDESHQNGAVRLMRTRLRLPYPWFLSGNEEGAPLG